MDVCVVDKRASSGLEPPTAVDRCGVSQVRDDCQRLYQPWDSSCGSSSRPTRRELCAAARDVPCSRTARMRIRRAPASSDRLQPDLESCAWVYCATLGGGTP